MVPFITVPLIPYTHITMQNTYSNPVDERGSKIGVPKSLVGIGDIDLGFFRCRDPVQTMRWDFVF